MNNRVGIHYVLRIIAPHTSLEACGGHLLTRVTVGRPSGSVPTVGSHCVGHAHAVRNRQGVVFDLWREATRVGIH
jgi:hypothetical protein